MLGKPIRLVEARDLYRAGLKIVSCYQYGKQDTADWLGGHKAGVAHAKRGWQLHTAAGGAIGAPVYASIDDDPGYEQYKAQVVPFLRGWESVLGRQRTGVYANSKTIEWALQDGIGAYYWQHNWGSPGRTAHPAAHLHQVEIDARTVAASGWTSTTSSSPIADSGIETYRSVMISSKVILRCVTVEWTLLYQVSLVNRRSRGRPQCRTPRNS